MSNYYIRESISNSISTYQLVLEDTKLHKIIEDIVDACVQTLRNGGKLLLAGNGGSAADAQHIAGELVSKFTMDRESLPALALTTDTSIITSIANDYGFEFIFSRQISGLGSQGDVFFAYSTSGDSPNIIEGLKEAQKKGLLCVGLTGNRKGAMTDLCHFLVDVPSNQTPRIQEVHALVGHIICGAIEAKLFGSE